MTGPELLIDAAVIDAAAKGITDFITGSTKTGIGSILGKTLKGLKDKSSQAIFQASRKYIETYQKRHCQLGVLGKSEPVDLSALYTGVKLLDSNDVLSFEVEALENTFRQNRFRGYSGRSSDDEKHSGITIANQKQYLMVLGGPGVGKSTFLKKVGLEALLTFYYEQAEYRHRLIPVLLELKQFDVDNLDIARCIADEFEICGFPEAKTFTQDALAQGNLLILLDGLDEAPSAQLHNVLQTIRDFVDRYDKNRFIASCRVAASGYRDNAFQRFTDVMMADFDDTQIQQFIENWFSTEQDKGHHTAEKCWEVLTKPENEASKELAHTPLLLTYLCRVYGKLQSFPKSLGKLHHTALRILLEEWKEEIPRDAIYEGLSIELEERLLSKIAYDGIVVDQLFFTKRELSKQIRTFLNNSINAPQNLDGEAVLNAIEVQQGILVERAENTYSFSHLTLQEYLAAQHLIDNDKWRALIENHITNSHWREIFLLLPGLMPGKGDTDKLLTAMEKAVNKCLSNSQLQQLFEWADLSTKYSKTKSQPAVRRLGAIYLALALIRSIFRDFNFFLDLNFFLDFAHSLDPTRGRSILSDLDQGLEYFFVLILDRGLANQFKRTELFSDVNFDELEQSLIALSGTEPHYSASKEEQNNFKEALYGLWFSALGLDSKTARLSQSEAQSLEDYFYICELMIRCKEGAPRVSPKVWEDIESRLFTVPATSATSKD